MPSRKIKRAGKTFRSKAAYKKYEAFKHIHVCKKGGKKR